MICTHVLSERSQNKFTGDGGQGATKNGKTLKNFWQLAYVISDNVTLTFSTFRLPPLWPVMSFPPYLPVSPTSSSSFFPTDTVPLHVSFLFCHLISLTLQFSI